MVDSCDLTLLFNEIVNTIPSPAGEIDKGFQMQVTTLDHDDYKGRYVIGKIERGKVKKGDNLVILRS